MVHVEDKPALNFPLPVMGQGELQLKHSGTGRPWAIIQTRAVIPLTEPLFAGFRLQRTVTPVTQKQAGV